MRLPAMGIALVLLLLAAAPAGAEDIVDPAYAALRRERFCEILGYLSAIHRAHRVPEQNRFLIIDVAGHRGYVQCALDHRHRKAICEAASG